MLTRALQYNNYLTVLTQIRKKNYIVHFVTINNEEKKIKTTAIYSLYNLYNYSNHYSPDITKTKVFII